MDRVEASKRSDQNLSEVYSVHMWTLRSQSSALGSYFLTDWELESPLLIYSRNDRPDAISSFNLQFTIWPLIDWHIDTFASEWCAPWNPPRLAGDNSKLQLTPRALAWLNSDSWAIDRALHRPHSSETHLAQFNPILLRISFPCFTLVIKHAAALGSGLFRL